MKRSAILAAVLVAVMVAVWMRGRTAPRPSAREIDQPLKQQLIQPETERIAFGLDAGPRDLAFRSMLDVAVEWSVRTGSRFEIVPESGTIPPRGRAVVKAQPRAEGLTVGLNAENTYFSWRIAKVTPEMFPVMLTAIRAPEVEYNVAESDAAIILTLNDGEVVRTPRTNGWVSFPARARLTPRDNQFKIIADVAVAYGLMMRIGSHERTFTHAKGEPLSNQRLTIRLDPDLGYISLSPE